MYAVIRVGGKQERVEPGDVIEVDYMQVDPGSAVEFRPLVVVDDQGKAHYGKALSEANVVARLLGDKKGDKVRVFKYRPKTGYRRSQGHRQLMTLLEVQEVGLGEGRHATAEAEPSEAAEGDPAGKAATKVPGGKKTPARKPTAKKTASKKPAARKATPPKPTAKKPPAKKTSAKKPGGKKSPGRKRTT